MPPILSVITPVYNESRNLETNVERIREALSRAGHPYEIIIVDDNSPDGSGAIADRLAGAYPNVKVLHRPGKMGLGTALKDAFPLSEGELRLMAGDLISVSDPRLLKLVMKGDDVAGFVFAYPDVAVALQRTRGRLFPLGWLRLLLAQQRSEWAVVNGIGLLPAYRGVGADVLLLTELERSLRARAFKHVDAVMVGEDNAPSRSNLEAIGVRWVKRHRSYRRRL